MENVIQTSKRNLMPPTKTEPIVGDGNCFFRALSQEMTGCQNFHEEIRKRVVKVIRDNDNNEMEQYIDGKTEDYLRSTEMAAPGTWATDAEVMAAAKLLQTTICIYTQSGSTRTWLDHIPIGEMGGSERIYLVNHCGHFERVISCKGKR